MATPATRRATKLRMTDWNYLKADLIWVYEGNVEQPYRNTRQHRQGQSALLMRTGQVRVETEHGSVVAKAGNLVFPPQGPRLQQFSDHARGLAVRFNPQWPGNQPLFDTKTALVLDSAAWPQLEKQ